MTQFTGDGEWLFEDFPVERRVDYYPEPYPKLYFSIKLQRKPLYYLYNLAVPAIFITFCGLLVFLLPPESGEKISLSVTVLLASTVFLLLVAETMPVQSDTVPLIGKHK